ncbi:MAG: extracellular solute-binding protein, partial [Clostridia bacterium]|nr:extracellular solute-binding protein [Clostridia bacterium]
THTTPNVCISYPDNVAAYLAGDNTVVSLDDLMSDPYYGLGGSKLKFDGPSFDEIVPQFIEEGVLEGHYYCLPYMRSTEALYVNKTFVEKLGYTLPDVVTWDFVFEVAEKALEKNEDGTYKVSGKNVLIPFIYKSTDNMMIQMLKQLDAGYSKPNGEVLIFNDTTRKLLLDISPHAKTKAFSTFKIVSYPGNYFNAGECIFAVDSTAGATWIGSNSPLKEISDDKIVDFETVTLPVPQFNVNEPKMISQGPSMCIFNKDDPEEVLASWLFAQFMLTDKVQIAYARTEGYVPVTLKAQGTDEYKDYLSRAGEDNDDYYHVKIDAAKLLLSNQQNTFVTPVFNHSADLRNAAGQLIEEVVKSNNRREEVNDAYIDALYEKVIKLYSLDEIEVKDETDDGPKKQELGKMPGGSIALLTVLGVVWAGLAAYYINEKIKAKKKNSK